MTWVPSKPTVGKGATSISIAIIRAQAVQKLNTMASTRIKLSNRNKKQTKKLRQKRNEIQTRRMKNVSEKRKKN